jgi:hypothetical protein
VRKDNQEYEEVSDDDTILDLLQFGKPIDEHDINEKLCDFDINLLGDVNGDEDVVACDVNGDEDVVACDVNGDEDVTCDVNGDEDVTCDVNEDEGVVACDVNGDADVVLCDNINGKEVNYCINITESVKNDEPDRQFSDTNIFDYSDISDADSYSVDHGAVSESNSPQTAGSYILTDDDSTTNWDNVRADVDEEPSVHDTCLAISDDSKETQCITLNFIRKVRYVNGEEIVDSIESYVDYWSYPGY